MKSVIIKLITLAENLIIPDVTKTEFNYCFIIHCAMENIQNVLCEMQHTKQPHHLKPFKCLRSLAKAVLRMRTARGIVSTYNWIADYTIIMLVHKITRTLKISRGLLANQNADSEYKV